MSNLVSLADLVVIIITVGIVTYSLGYFLGARAERKFWVKLFDQKAKDDKK